MQESIANLGALAIIVLFTIKELFAWLKTRKNGGTFNEVIFKELQTMNNNHLHSIQNAIEQGNERLITTIHSDNTKMVELLGEIKGNLNSRR